MKRPRSPRSSERLDYEGDEAEASSRPSSSSSRVRKDGFEYDVFLSFRGPDTRNTFTAHLHQALKDKGIITFIDNENLETGQKVEELFRYIEKSKIFVLIFSKGYADSEWCLKEITKIMECGRLIIPVFFHVEPTHVRHQTGDFESAFKGYDTSQKKDLNKWRDALRKAGEVSGYDLAQTKGDEAELIRRIVKRLLTEVNKTCLFVTKHPVGLDSRVADVMEVLDIESHGDARIVGIYGMGGMGKTTLAKAVYNQISSHFEACSFLSNIRASGLVSLQKQMLGNIFQDKDVDINSSDEGIGKIQERIGAKKVLLVLDDVDDQSQLDELVGSLDWFCSGSRIIITTRDKGALREQRVSLYELEKLDAAQSLQLFSWHAFGKEKPDAKFAKLSEEVASIASGLPLALKVFGPLFYGRKTDEEWENMLARLKAAQHKGIYEKLRISYDVLEEEEKKVFLDIACFFVGQGIKPKRPAFMRKGEEREHAIFMWKACGVFPETTIEVLMSKCLVSINDRSGDFEMHDQIRDIGRKIVKDESPNSKPEMRNRLWKTDEALDVLQNMTGTEKIEAIQLNSGILEKYMYVEAESFIAMSELRMLRLGEFVHLKGEFQHFPKKLRWLQWCIQGYLDSLPDGLRLENIVVLDLSNSYITQLWNPQGLESTKDCGKMKVLKLTKCHNLTICPDFTSMPYLQKLNLSGCHKMSELHPSIGLLKSLNHLSLRYCSLLKRVPQEIWQLTSLEELDLKYCHEITSLPSQMEDPKSFKPVLLDKLKVLNFAWCYNLISCPDFTSMPHLQKLNFWSCQKMSELHPSIGLLKSLIYLNLGCCSSLKELTPEIWQLTSLTRLSLKWCSSLTEIPDCICSFLNLEELDLSWTAIEEMPHSFVSLENLQSLSVSHCYQLKSLPWLPPSLTELRAEGCGKLEDVPGIKQMKLLQMLDLGGCRSLHDSFLERLEDANFQNLEAFSIPGRRLIDGGLSYPQSLSFLLPKQFEYGTLYLHVEKSSLDNICSELELVYKSIPSDEVIDSQPGRVVTIEITTGDAQFHFSAPIKIQEHDTSEEDELRDLPTAAFGRDSELRKMAKQGEFIGNDDAQLGTMMTMRVSIDGCVLLHGDLFTYTNDYVDWLHPDPIKADDNLVIVEF